VAIVLYDGDCGLCQAAVRLVLDRDREGHLRFARQSSEIGRRLLAAHGVSRALGRTLVLLEDGRAYLRSDAALKIAGYLAGPLRWVKVLRTVPRPLRDLAYDVVAFGRRALAGPPADCPLPTPELRRRFLDSDGHAAPSLVLVTGRSSG
jgi:predicted DCC family thiol-disulfide oxidoreductase YuxK